MTWVDGCYDTESEELLSQWKSPNSLRTTKALFVHKGDTHMETHRTIKLPMGGFIVTFWSGYTRGYMKRQTFFSMSTRPRTHRSCSEKSIVIPLTYHVHPILSRATSFLFSKMKFRLKLPFWHKRAYPGASNAYTSGRPWTHGKRWDRCIYAQPDNCEGGGGN